VLVRFKLCGGNEGEFEDVVSCAASWVRVGGWGLPGVEGGFGGGG
jgi:hypothetical protein